MKIVSAPQSMQQRQSVYLNNPTPPYVHGSGYLDVSLICWLIIRVFPFCFLLLLYHETCCYGIFGIVRTDIIKMSVITDIEYPFRYYCLRMVIGPYSAFCRTITRTGIIGRKTDKIIPGRISIGFREGISHVGIAKFRNQQQEPVPFRFFAKSNFVQDVRHRKGWAPLSQPGSPGLRLKQNHSTAVIIPTMSANTRAKYPEHKH